MMKHFNPRLATCFKNKSKRSISATVLTQIKKTRVKKNWVLLDSQSMIDVLYNPSLLTNIQTSPDKLQLFYNTDTFFTNQVVYLDGYGTVWFYPEGIAKKFSLHRVTITFHVTYDSRIDEKFIVWKESERSCHLILGPRGL